VALADERGAAAPHDGPVGESFDRQPPQDLAAEQSVLGGMMLSKDAIADVVEVCSPSDFYRPAHQTIYNVILDLYGRGEPADAITVSADLERRQELLKVGGAPYMHTLIATVPTAANAGYYAEIVAEKAVLRRLVEAGTRIVQLGYHGSEGQAIEEVVDRAQAAVHEVTERRANEDYAALEDMLQPTMDEIDAIASRGGQSQGVPTGFADLDDLTNGLHAGQMIIVAARPGVGKALALDTDLPTPDGWTTMGSVAVGDQLLGSDGRPTEVVAATEVLHDRPCFEVEFSDGSVLVADARHQWRLSDGSVVTTEQLQGGEIAGHAALDLPERELPVSPYLLGLWLAAGDAPSGRLQLTGASRRAAGARGFESEVDEETAEQIRAVGAWDDHDLPGQYLRGSEQQRRELLAGLLDAAGSVADDGSVRLAINQPVSVRARELVLGLGYGCAALPPSEDVSERFDTTLLEFRSGDDEVFGCPERAEQHKRLRRSVRTSWQVVEVRSVPSVPVRCVEVAAADHMYLAGRSMVPTHNSTLGLDFARATSIKHGGASVIFSLEMGKTEIVMRMLSAEAQIRLGDMRGGKMTDEDWTRLARRMSEISEAPLFVDDSPNLTMMEIRAKARRLKQRHDIQLIVVDYMQLMTSGKKVESRQQEVSEFSRSLKLLAKELEVPVVAISQLNRGPEQRNDKKPQLADLRESGSLEQDADMVILIHRPDAFERDDPRMGEADLILAKHRSGPVATVTVAHQLHYSRFVDMAPE
jgi:replicative DNA helicase